MILNPHHLFRQGPRGCVSPPASPRKSYQAVFRDGRPDSSRALIQDIAAVRIGKLAAFPRFLGLSAFSHMYKLQMLLSLRKAAHVDLSDVAKQEFGYAPVGRNKMAGQNLRAHLEGLFGV